MLYRDGAVLLGLVYSYLPFAVLPLYTVLEKLDTALLEAAADLGARPFAVLWRVTLPLALPGFVAAAILVFIPCLGSYLTPDLLGGGKTVMAGNLIQNQFGTARGLALRLGSVFAVNGGIDADAAYGRPAAGEGLAVKRWLGGYALAVFVFLYAPLAILIAFSFNSSRSSVWEHFSWQWYGHVFHDAEIAESTMNSAIIALLSAAIATVLGTAAAYGIWKRRAPLFSASLYLSLVTPEIVTGVSLLAFFQWVFHWTHWHLGLFTVVLAHVAFSIAYVAVVVSARLKAFDPALEEAALDLGANDWQAFRRVTLPFLLPGVFAAALLALIVSFDDYVITSLVAGVDSETLPIVVYAMARRGTNPALNAISTLIVLFFGVLILLSERVRKT